VGQYIAQQNLLSSQAYLGVSVHDCLFLCGPGWTGDPSMVDSVSYPMAAGIGSSHLQSELDKVSTENG